MTISLVHSSPPRTGNARLWLVDDAYAALKRAIMESMFPPGHQVSEQELALRFGMSRTPIHEAALKLQQEGLVRIVPKRGIIICALAPDDMREIYEVIIAIESGAAERIAAFSVDNRNIIADALLVHTGRMSEALAEGNLEAWGLADAGFHACLVDRCGNARFSKIIQTVKDQSHRSRMLTLSLRPQLAVSIDEHRAIIDAIRAGLPGAAHEAARHHRVRARDELLPLIEKAGLKHL